MVLIVEKAIVLMKKRRGRASRQNWQGCLALRGVGDESEAAVVPFPQRSRPHQNPRVAMRCLRQLFSPIGENNCHCGVHLRVTTQLSNPDS